MDRMKDIGQVAGRTGQLHMAAVPDIEAFRVPGLPPAAYYVPNFITEQEEEFLQRKIAESPQPKWKTVGTGRRLQYWGGNMSKSGVLLPEPLPTFLLNYPPLRSRIKKFIAEASKQAMRLDINQVLINEYQPDQGISPHEDGPAFDPLVATISLGSHTVLEIFHYVSHEAPSPPMTAAAAGPIAAVPLGKLLLMPRSLLILSGSLYTSHLHGIEARPEDTNLGIEIANIDQLGDDEASARLKEGTWSKSRSLRTSLTFRHAKKTLRGGLAGLLSR